MMNVIISKAHICLRIVVALLLVVTLICSVGCDGGQGVTSSDISSTDSSTDGSSNSSDNTDNTDNTESEIDRLNGEVSFEFDVETYKERTDANEIVPNADAAFLTNQLKGYYEDEANTLRDKILKTDNTEKYYTITGTKYYVSPGGDDSNSGTSPQEAFQTVEALSNVEFAKGDAVLFERDSIFRITSSIVIQEGVIYGSYGTGDKPKIYASAKNFAEFEWKPSKRKNIWQITYVYDSVGNVVFEHGKEIGVLKTSIRQLTENGQFYHDESQNVLYIYCDKGNPSLIYDSIEACAGINMFYIPSGVGNIVIDNLCLLYCSGFGVRGYYNNHDVTITNCEMGFMGGYRWNGTRMGNAIQLWQGAREFRVENNWIYQTFDTAVTWQGQGGAKSKYENIYFIGNLLEYNHTDFEFWDHGKYGDGSATLSNFVISDNISRFNTLGWGSRSNDAGLRGFEGFIFGNTDTSTTRYDEIKIIDKVVVKNNIIDCPGNIIVNWEVFHGDLSTKYDISGTKIYIDSSMRQSNSALRGFKHTASDELKIDASTANEMITVMKKFDNTAVVNWK